MEEKKTNTQQTWLVFFFLAGCASYFGAISANEKGGWPLMIAIFCGLTAIVLPLMMEIQRPR